MEKLYCDQRLECPIFTSTFVPAEIDEIAIEKLFGEFEIEKYII
jgi:hypothetical protein